MAYVASSDRHGNEIMRVMLCTEQRTIASCHNLHINCKPERKEPRYGHCDHNQKLHYYAKRTNCNNMNIIPKIDMAQIKVIKPQHLIGCNLKENIGKWSKDEVNAHSTMLSTTTDVSKIPEKLISNIRKECSDPPTSVMNFCSWLTAKNEAQQQLAEERRLNIEAQTERAKERACLAQIKYDNWLNEKTRQMQRSKSNLSSKDLSKRNTSVNTSSPNLCKKEEEDTTINRLYEWERKKIMEKRRQREERESRESFQIQLEQKRRELGEEVWLQWVKLSHNKPKPVPMGQGLNSLRGTISPHYINPNEWQPLIKDNAKSLKPQQEPNKIQHRIGPDYERLDRLAQPKKKLWLQTFQDPIKLKTKPNAAAAASMKMDRSQSTLILNKQSNQIHLNKSDNESPSVTWRSCICLSQDDDQNDQLSSFSQKLEQTDEDKNRSELLRKMGKSMVKPINNEDQFNKSKPGKENRKVIKQIPWR